MEKVKREFTVWVEFLLQSVVPKVQSLCSATSKSMSVFSGWLPAAEVAVCHRSPQPQAQTVLQCSCLQGCSAAVPGSPAEPGGTQPGKVIPTFTAHSTFHPAGFKAALLLL